VIREKVYGTDNEMIDYNRENVVERPPILCAGCPHRGLFYELGKKKNVMVAGDIGCYTLGFAPPYNAMDFNICMGASISAGHGAQQAFDRMGVDMRVVSVLGDSTFFHTGINSLMDVLYNNSRTVNIILDNRVTAMTGHQENPGTGRHADSSHAPVMDIEEICKALGARNIRVIDPNDIKLVRETLNWGLSLDEPSVIITRWPCAIKKLTEEDQEEFKNAFQDKYAVDPEKCITCKLCLRCGCPAVSIDKTTNKSSIDRSQCAGCGVCAQICPQHAIQKEGK
jgi:indolepyruvate ferredoxin oxidoreductase alpha subunit